MKRAHVIPIYDGQVLLSAHPEFVGPGESLYDDPNFKRPKIWSYEQLDDGSTVIHWVSAPNASEQLAFMDSGFHPIIVPSDAIEVIDAGHEVQHRKPKVIQILGTNTAYIRDSVTLVPYRPSNHNQTRHGAAADP